MHSKGEWPAFLFYLVIVLLVAVLGYIKGAQSVETEYFPVVMKKPELKIVYKRDTLPIDTVYLPGDTVYVDSSTPIGSIPIRTAEFDRDLELGIANQDVVIPVHGEFDYRGIAYQCRIQAKVESLNIRLPVPAKAFVKLSGTFGSFLYPDLEIFLTGNILLKEKFVILGGVYYQTTPGFKVGLAVHF